MMTRTLHFRGSPWMSGRPVRAAALLTLLAFSLLTGCLYAQSDLKMNHLTTEDGLSYRWSFDVTQDSMGILWISTYDGLNRYDGHRFTVYRPQPYDSLYIATSRIRQTIPDEKGDLWVLLVGGRLLRFHPGSGRFEPVSPGASFSRASAIMKIFRSEEGALLATLLDTDTKKYRLARLEKTGDLHPLLSFEAGGEHFYLTKAGPERYWHWSAGNYVLLDLRGGEAVTFPFRDIPQAAIAHPRLPIDGQKRFWFPGPDGGFDFFHLPSAEPLTGWKSFFLDNEENIWLLTRLNHLYRYHRKQDEVQYFGQLSFLEHAHGDPFVDREGNIWLPHFYGLTQLVQRRRLFENHLHQPLNELGVAPDGISVYVLREREDGSVLIDIAGDQTLHLEPETGRVEFYSDTFIQGPSLSTAALRETKKRLPSSPYAIRQAAFFEDREQGVLWFSPEISKGVLRIDLQTGREDFFPLSDYPITVWCLLSHRDVLWAGTDQGLYRLEPESAKIRQFTTRQGLPHNIVYSILRDEDRLWLGTHNGLCRFDSRSGAIKNYYVEDGLTHNEFNRRSALKTRDGKMYFGGLNGLNAFYPGELEKVDRTFQPQLNLVRFSRIDGRLDTQRTVDYPSGEVNGLRLNPQDHTLTFDFALNSYLNPSQNQYFYYLEGWEPPWNNETTEGRAAYLHLPPGSYTLRVKAADPLGNPAANEIALPILMPRVWYRRWWAWSAYLATLLLGGYLLYRRQLERREAVRLRELDEVKSRLYTNITHEFRTPLTVMLGLTEQLRDGPWQSTLQEPVRRDLQNKLSIIGRNGDNLLRLINQLLDLSKLEAGKFSLHLTQDDIIAYLRYLAASFHSFAAAQKIELHFLPDTESFYLDFDRDRLFHILSNLLSNAVKFTPEDGHIYLQTVSNPDLFIIKVKDTGAGIPEDRLPHIFERFYQVDDSSTRPGEGTGIGLTLVRELVKMMQGEISVKSQVGRGSEFTVALPVSRSAPLATEAKTPAPLPAAPPKPIATDERPEQEDRPLLLVVEDNADIVHYIRTCLETQFRILEAADGQEGIDKAVAEVPDLIISDVMMPVRDGFDLLRTLKEDERTSHIPIVLLTARADTPSKLEGLEKGADAYLSKPFHQKELQLRLRNLLEQQRRLQEKYAGQDYNTRQAAARPGTATGPEDAFLLKAAAHILENLDDPDFGNDALARRMTMSESQLNRKIKALTGRTLAIFIRGVRLREGKKMLAETDLNISEIAYAVGFTDPAYFSRTFSREFGQAPSAFRN